MIFEGTSEMGKEVRCTFRIKDDEWTVQMDWLTKIVYDEWFVTKKDFTYDETN